MIKREREVQGLTVKALAKKSGVRQDKILAQEREQTPLSVEDLFKVSAAMDDNIVWDLANYYRGEI